MKSNKEIVFDFMQKGAASQKEHPGYMTQDLSEQLHMQRPNVSAILNTLVKEHRIEKLSGRPVYYRVANLPNMQKKEESCFKKMIGYDGGMKNAVQLAKAAILYPQHSLHTLIIGPIGSGKSFFAELMYEFAIEHHVIQEGAPFIKFNCRYYENGTEDLLVQHLFGAEDGADGAIKRAKAGVLFIDHIDLLPARACNLLLNLIDQERSELMNTMIICAIDDSANKTMKDVLFSKFSMKIELPSLHARPMAERLSLIQTLFTKEALKMGRMIKINSELLRCILLYRCEHNVKQLKMDIKVGCANAYVREFSSEAEVLHVYIHDFPSYVRKGFLFYKSYRNEIETLIPDDYSYTFSSENMEKVQDVTAGKANQQETVYEVIQQKAAELRERGIMEEDISTIISADIERDLKKVTDYLVNENINKESLAKIVDSRIISMVERFLKEAIRQFGRIYPVSTYYGLCLHLSAMLERDTKTTHLANEQIMQIVETYKEEYIYCMQFSTLIEKEFHVHLPIDEVVFITMFICDQSLQKKGSKKPVVLIAMHGNTTASSICDVVNALVKNENTYAYDLSLEKDMQAAYEELKEYIQEIDEGKGVLLLYDMGSLKTMAEMISQETGIQICMMELPATLIALDCSRKASSIDRIDELYDNVIETYNNTCSTVKLSYNRQSHHAVIITLCMSGKGGALSIKNYLESNLELKDIDVVPFAISDREYLLNEVNLLKKKHDIMCVIGTYDPKLYQIPFISITKLFETPADKLPMLLALEEITYCPPVNYHAIYDYLSEQMPTLDMKLLKKYLPKTINSIKKTVGNLSQDQELGLFMHIACSIYRIQQGEKSPANIHKDSILNKNKRLYNDIKDLLAVLEEVFSMIFNDDEVANIICIIKQI